MKLRLSHGSSRQGNVLLVALCTMLIVGLALVTYLTLGKNQNQLVMRAQVWNASLPLAEAGLEDALNHCTWNRTNWVSNGWSLTSSNTYSRSNTLSVGWYKVIIATNAAIADQLTITSTGYYPMPGSDLTHVPRTVQVRAIKMPPYKFAMMAKHGIEFNGNTCKVDSYDSSDPAKSTGGLYDAAKAGDKADMATYVGAPLATYDLGNGNIWGKVFMGAAGKIQIGPIGKVGSVSYQATGPKGTYQPGWFRTDLNVTIPDVVLPFTGGGVPPLPGVVGGKLYTAVFSSGFYEAAFLTGEVIVTGDAIVSVTGPVDCNMFRIQTNASVRMYCRGNFRFKDTDNLTQRAASFQIYGLPTCTTFALDNEFMGAVYAPNASVVINGSKQIFGSVVADRIRLTGGADVHFDEALTKGKQGDNFIITSWNEL